MIAWINKHKLPSLLLLIWVMVLVTMLVRHYTGHGLGSANTADGVIFSVIFGLPALAVGLFKWSRGGE